MRDAALMRTTIQLDDDILAAARSLAAQSDRSLGQVISELVRKALQGGGSASDMGGDVTKPKTRNGVPLLEPIPGAPVPSLELVNQLK